MCTISINPASIVAVPVGTSGWVMVTLSGTVANCTSSNVRATVACSGFSNFGDAVLTGNTWKAQVRVQCPCGTPVTITATCNDTPPCTDTLNTTLTCTCCPKGNISYCVEYGPSGQALVKFENYVTVQSGCAPVQVQRDFGDGSPLGIIKTFSSGNNKYTEIHAYNISGNYTSTLNILSPSSCSPAQTTVQISPPPLCSTSSLFGAICKILQFFFLLDGSVAVVLFASSFFGCLAVNQQLTMVALALGVAAVLFLLLLWFLCRKCTCKLLLKLLGQLLLVIGVLFSLFILQPNCLILSFTINPLSFMIGATIVVFLIAFFILYRLWYGQGCCPVTICDFWQAVGFAMTVAFLAAPLVFVILPGGVLVAGLGLALVLAYLIWNFASVQITINQGANNC